jgi:hypothetical protein
MRYPVFHFMWFWHLLIVVEGTDHGRAFVHDGCRKPCPWRGLWVPRILSELWDPVHEPGKYPLNPQQFPVCAAAMFLPRWSVKVSTYSFLTIMWDPKQVCLLLHLNLFIYGLFNDAVNITRYVVSHRVGWLVTDELESTWKDAVMG